MLHHSGNSVRLLSPRCFAFAELPWYQRKVAAVIFASPPSSTYEEVRIRTTPGFVTSCTAEMTQMLFGVFCHGLAHLDKILPFFPPTLLGFGILPES